MSKTLTAIVIQRLLAEKGLTPEAFIAPYPPGDWTLGSGVQHLRFRHFLTHTSGFGQINAGDDYAALRTAIGTAVGAQSFSYRNANFGLMRVLAAGLQGIDPVDYGEFDAETLTTAAFLLYAQSRYASIGVDVDCAPADQTRTLQYRFPDDGTPGYVEPNRQLTCGGYGWFISANEIAAVLTNLRNTTNLLSAAARTAMQEGFLGFMDPANYGFIGGVFGLNDSVFDILQNEGDNYLGLNAFNVPVTALASNEYSTGVPDACDSVGNCPPATPLPTPLPLFCPPGTQGGNTCPIGLAPGAVPGVTLSANLWNLNGSNPRPGGSPQYGCLTPLSGQVDVGLWNLITVGDLFWHRAGFYRGTSYIDTIGSPAGVGGDVTYMPSFITRRLPLGHRPPPTAQDIARFTAGSCLYYQPVACNDGCCSPGNVPKVVDPFGYCTELDGATYSNVGYNLLGRIVEIRSGMSYESYVQEKLLDPNGLEDIQLGRTRVMDRDPREPTYFAALDKTGPDLFTAECDGDDQVACSDGLWQFPNEISVPDGGDFAMEYRDAQGGWTATSCELAEFLKVYRISDGFPRTPGVFPTGGEGTQFGSFHGTRAYTSQWGNTVNVADVDDPPDGCRSWGCLLNANFLLPLGAGFHVAAIFNKRACEPGDCDVEGGYNFLEHSVQKLPQDIGLALFQLDAVPEAVVCGCGSGLRDVGEECDGDDLGGVSCTDLGFEGGQLACTDQCTFSTEPCNLCGNGVVDDGEVCDGGDFDGVSCGSLGFTGGDLQCIACLGIDSSGCGGGMSSAPPGSYEECGFDEDDCADGACAGSDGDCPGGPCRVTDPGDYAFALEDPLNTQGGQFHPDGNYSGPNGDLYFCQQDGGTHMTCIEQGGWGVCKRCSKNEGELNTLIGCPCQTEEDCESPAQPGLACFGEDFPGGTGFCWDQQDGPPAWQCAAGTCGQVPRYSGDEEDDDDEMYCEHYPHGGGQARCEPWFACNPILARVCAGVNLICMEDPGGCTEQSCCTHECETDTHCGPTFNWPPGYTCTLGQCVGP